MNKILEIGVESTIKVPELMTVRPCGCLKYESDEPVVHWRYSNVMVKS
jgi:hypothetical protein